MKRILPLLLSLAIAPLAHAAPATKAKAPQNRTNAAAVALLEKSARSYAKLRGLSMRFTEVSRHDGKTTQGSGLILVARPALARIEFNSAGKTLMVVGDAKKTRVLRDPKMFATSQVLDENPVQSVLGQIPSWSRLPLEFLTIGENPLTANADFWWENVTLLPDNGVAMTARFSPSAPTPEFRLFFDKKNALLRRVETRTVFRGQESRSVTTISDVKLNPKFAPDAFVFTPPLGAQEQILPPRYNPQLKVGAAPLPLTRTDLKGRSHALESYRSKVVLLDFWATWCVPCIEELPNLLGNYQKYKAQGLEVIGVALDEDKSVLTDFLATHKLPWPQIFDGQILDGENATRYGVQGIPFTLLIGRDGKIAAVNPRGPQLEKAIRKALK